MAGGGAKNGLKRSRDACRDRDWGARPAMMSVARAPRPESNRKRSARPTSAVLFEGKVLDGALTGTEWPPQPINRDYNPAGPLAWRATAKP